MAPVLGYWDLRGLCEPIRYLLHYKGIEFEDKRYVVDFAVWAKEKFTLGLDFPNLPYFIDGDVRATQSLAILRYLAKKHGLAGSSDSETLKMDTVEQTLYDLRMRMAMVCYAENMEEKKVEYKDKLPDQLKQWVEFLGDKKFLMGDAVTYIDFMAYEAFDFHDMFLPEVVAVFPSLKEYMKRVRQLPELQSYFNSSTYKTWPFLGPMAKFGGSGEEPKRE